MMLRLAVLLLTAIARTWRVSVNAQLPTTRSVIAFWHGDMLPVWWWCRTSKATALVSRSKDGEYLATLLGNWGYSLVRGSSSQGGSEALAELVDVLKTSSVMVTPDGPRGPRHIAKPGAVVAAQRSGVPVIPVRVVRMSKAYTFGKSWDQFRIPLPFARITLECGEELWIDREATRDDVALVVDRLTRELHANVAE